MANNSNNGNSYQTTDNSTLQDYEQEVKKGFFASLLDKFKGQKLLGTGSQNKTHVVNYSVSTMWNIRSITSSVMNAIEKVQNSILKPKAPTMQNGFKTEIIGATSQQKSNTLESEKSPDDLTATTEQFIKPASKEKLTKPFINPAIQVAQRATSIQNRQAPKEKSDIDIPADGLTVSTINDDGVKEQIEKTELEERKSKVQSQIKQARNNETLTAVNLNVGNITIKHKDSDDRSRDD